jgi:hypothetical protein
MDAILIFKVSVGVGGGRPGHCFRDGSLFYSDVRAPFRGMTSRGLPRPSFSRGRNPPTAPGCFHAPGVNEIFSDAPAAVFWDRTGWLEANLLLEIDRGLTGSRAFANLIA